MGQTDEKLCECLRKSIAQTTLVTGRELYSRAYAYTAGTPTRVQLRLERGEHTAGFVVLVQAHETAGAGSDVVLLLRVGADTDAGAVRSQMLLGAALRVMPEKGYTHALPAWQRVVNIDAAGIEKGAGTDSNVSFTVTVYELVGVEQKGRC